MSIDAFFAWQEAQAERYELVGGVPMRGTAVRGRRFRPFTGEGNVETFPGRIRRPDIGVARGRGDPNVSTAAQAPVAIDALSPSTRCFDAFARRGRNSAMADLEQISLVEPDTAEMRLWSPGSDRARVEERILGLDTNIPLTAPDIATPAADIDDGVTFPARLARVARPVADEPGGSTA